MKNLTILGVFACPPRRAGAQFSCFVLYKFINGYQINICKARYPAHCMLGPLMVGSVRYKTYLVQRNRQK